MDTPTPSPQTETRQTPLKQKRRLLPLVLFTMLIISTIGFFAWRTQTPKTGGLGAGAVPTPIPMDSYPTIPISVGGISPQTTEFIVAFSPTRLPEKLPSYSATETEVTSFGERVANALNIKSSSRTQSGVYYWESSGARVSAQAQPPSFSYTSPQTTNINTPPNDQEAISLSDTFFTSINAFEGQFSTRVHPVRRITGEGTHPEPQATPTYLSIAIVGYKVLLQNAPIIDATGGELQASAWVGPDKKIQHASGPILPTLTQTSETLLVPPEQALVALKNSKATLLRVDRNQTDVSASVINPTIKQATITSMVVAYFWDSEQNTLKPVYTFDGEAPDPADQTKKLLLRYILAATP